MSMSARLMIASAVLLLSLLAYADDFPLDESLAVDTPATTVAGNPFTAPAEWRITVKGPATIITAPEGGSQVVYVDVEADDAEAALANMINNYKRRGFTVTKTNDNVDGELWHAVNDASGRPRRIYYIDVG